MKKKARRCECVKTVRISWRTPGISSLSWAKSPASHQTQRENGIMEVEDHWNGGADCCKKVTKKNATLDNGHVLNGRGV